LQIALATERFTASEDAFDLKTAAKPSQRFPPEYLAFGLILILATVLSCYRIAEPAWYRPHTINFGGAVDGWRGLVFPNWGATARNYLKFGFLEAGPRQVAYRLPANPSLSHYRVNHPSLLPLLASLSFRLFGVHEWSARLVLLLSSTGLLLLVFGLGRELGGTKIALAASSFFALFPVRVYYSTLVNPHILASFFSLLTFVFYLWWVERGGTKYYAGMYASFILGTLSDWITYWVVPPILLHYLVCEYRKTKNLKFVLFFALMPLVLFGTHLSWTYTLGGKWALEGLLDRFLLRTSSRGTGEGQLVFAPWDLYAFGYTRAKLFLTPVVCFLSVAWFGDLITASLRGRLSKQNMFVLALFLFGLSYNLVFRNAVYIHDYHMFFHLTPFFAIAATLGAQFIVQKILRNRWVWVIPFVVLVGYSFGAQSISALRWLLNAPVRPHSYLVGSKVNEITGESTKVMSSFEADIRMLFYSDRAWSEVRDLSTMRDLLEGDGDFGLYTLDPQSAESVGRKSKEYLVRNYPVENFYNHSFFDLRGSGSNVIVQDPQIAHPAEVNFDDKLMFLGYNVEKVVQKKREPSWLEKYLKGHVELLPEYRTFFRITYFWQCLKEMEEDYTLVTQFEGHHGKTYRIDQSHQGVNGAYPTSMWREGEVIREEYQVEVPADYPPIRYALWVGVRDGEEGLLEVVSDAETDEENRVRLGQIEMLPAERPTPLAAEPQPQNRVEMNINDDLMFLGYDLSERNLQPSDQVKVTTYWQSLRETERDYVIQVELRNGGYKVREVLDLAPTRLWEEGRYYRGDAVIAINPHLLGGTYSLNLGLERDDGTGTQISLASLDIPCRRRHIISRLGKANYGGSEILRPDEPLSLRFHLKERETLEVVAGWTGRAEGAETRVEVYIAQPYSRERYLGTWVIGPGRYTATKRRIPRSLTAPGQNVIELRVPKVRERVHNIGWRGVVDQVFPDLLQDPRTDYDGPIQMDFAQVSTQWEGDWEDYYDLAEVYSQRGMMGEIAKLYEEAMEEGVEPGRVDDFSLFKRAYRALGEEGKVREIEERIAGLIAHKMNVSLGVKVEFLGYSMRGEGDNYGVSLFFKCLEEMGEDYTLWVHGEVEDESLLEGRRREAGYAVFDHLLPTSRWQVGEVYQDDEVRGLRPGRYHFTLGLWRPEDGSRLWREDDPNAHVIDLGWIDVR